MTKYEENMFAECLLMRTILDVDVVEKGYILIWNAPKDVRWNFSLMIIMYIARHVILENFSGNIKEIIKERFEISCVEFNMAKVRVRL